MSITIDARKRQERVAYNANHLEEYHGYAPPGSTTAAAVWAISKSTYTAEMLLDKVQWANTGSDNNKWTERLTYTYN